MQKIIFNMVLALGLCLEVSLANAGVINDIETLIEQSMSTKNPSFDINDYSLELDKGGVTGSFALPPWLVYLGHRFGFVYDIHGNLEKIELKAGFMAAIGLKLTMPPLPANATFTVQNSNVPSAWNDKPEWFDLRWKVSPIVFGGSMFSYGPDELGISSEVSISLMASAKRHITNCSILLNPRASEPFLCK